MKIVIDGYQIDGTAVEVANLILSIRDDNSVDEIALEPLPALSSYSYYGTRMDLDVIGKVHEQMEDRLYIAAIKTIRQWAKVNAPGQDGLKAAKLWADAYGDHFGFRDWTNTYDSRPDIYHYTPRDYENDDLPF